jgi:hypothetical protein
MRVLNVDGRCNDDGKQVGESRLNLKLARVRDDLPLRFPSARKAQIRKSAALYRKKTARRRPRSI